MANVATGFGDVEKEFLRMPNVVHIGRIRLSGLQEVAVSVNLRRKAKPRAEQMSRS